MRIKYDQLSARSEQAYTLAELVVSLIIIGIGVAALMYSFRFAFLLVQLAQENQRATQIILEKTEAVRLCTWDQINSNGFVPATFTDYYDPTASSGSKGVTYTGTCAIANFPLTTVPYHTNMRQLAITIYWYTKGIPHARTNTTYVSRDGLQNYVF